MVAMQSDQKRYENALVQELTKRAVSQGIVDTADELVIRDILPLTDLAGTTTGATSSSNGFTDEVWRVDLRSYQRDGSTASAANAYNIVTNVDLNQKKLVGFLGIEKRGDEDPVSAVRFSLGGTKIKDIWNIEGVQLDETYWGENPMIYNGTNTVKIEYYLKSPAIVYHRLVGKTAEPKGDVILGAD